MVNIVRQVWLARKTVHHTKLDRNVHRLKTSNTPGIGITLSNILSSFYSFSSKSKATMLKNVKQALAPIVLQSLYRNKEIHIYSRMDRSRIGLNFQAISDEVYHPSDQYALRHLFTCVILSTSGQSKYQFINYQTSSQFFNCFYSARCRNFLCHRGKFLILYPHRPVVRFRWHACSDSVSIFSHGHHDTKNRLRFQYLTFEMKFQYIQGHGILITKFQYFPCFPGHDLSVNRNSYKNYLPHDWNDTF